MPSRLTTTTFQQLLDEGMLEIGDGYRAQNNELGGTGPIFLRAGHVTDSHIDFAGVEHFREHLADSGSACVWHQDTDAFRMHRTRPDEVWSQSDLEMLLTLKRVSISDVMTEFGLCNQGSPIRMSEPRAIGEEFRLPSRVIAVKARGERVQIRNK